MVTFKTWDGLIEYIRQLRDEAEVFNGPPLYEANVGEWLNNKSDVDLIELKPGVMGEVHDVLYTGKHYEINIYTRAFKDEATRRRHE